MRHVRSSRWIRRSLLVVLAIVAVGASACAGQGGQPGQSGQSGGGPTTAKELVLATNQDDGSLTPYTNITGYPGKNLSLLVFETLLRLDADNQVKPLLGLSAEPSQNSKVYTVPLRQGVKWQDGQAFTSADVKFTVEYYTKYNLGDSAPEITNIDSVEAQPDKAVFTLKTPDPEFPIRTLIDMRIMPQHVWQSITDPKKATAQQAIGTGPYKLTTYDKDKGYTFEANPDYVAGKAKVDRIRVVFIPEQQTAVAAVRTGEVQVLSRSITGQAGKDLANQGGVTIARGPEFVSTLLTFNNTRAPFDRAEVRSALAMAIDRDELVRTVLLGEGTPGSPGFVAPQAPGSDPALKPVFDATEAGRRLDALGARPGPDGIRVLDGKPMSYELLTQSTLPVRVRSAELIAEMLRKVGVAIKVTSLDFNTQQQRVWPDFDTSKTRDYEMAMWGWSAPTQYSAARVATTVYSDPVIGRLNISGTKDPELDRLSEQVLGASTLDQRAAMSKQLQAKIAEKMPFVTLFYPNGAYPYRQQTYAGWVYQKGAGILNSASFVDFKN